MHKKLLIISFFCGLFCLSGTSVLAAEYYIDAANGNDSQVGSQTAPWKTLAKITSTSIAAGDTVYLKGTFFSTDRLVLDSALSNITITNWSGETPVVTLAGGGNKNFEISANNTTISGIAFSNQGTYLSLSYAVYFNQNVSTAVVKQCTFQDSYIAIYINSGSSNVVIYNNLFNNTGGTAIAGNTITNLNVFNNTFSANPSQVNTAGVYVAMTTGNVKNNIFLNHTGEAVGFGSVSGITCDYNLYYNNTAVGLIMAPAYTTYATLAEWQALGFDAHSLSSDPLFVSTSDYHLQPTSPAINAGTDLSSSLTTDYDGDIRPSGSAFDIGYDEYLNPDFTPDQVTGVKVPISYKKAKQVKVKWTTIADATGYTISLYKYNKKSDKYKEYKNYRLTDDSISKIIKKLTAQTKYKVRVRAKRAVEGATYAGKWSAWVKFKTKAK